MVCRLAVVACAGMVYVPLREILMSVNFTAGISNGYVLDRQRRRTAIVRALRFSAGWEGTIFRLITLLCQFTSNAGGRQCRHRSRICK